MMLRTKNLIIRHVASVEARAVEQILKKIEYQSWKTKHIKLEGQLLKDRLIQGFLRGPENGQREY